MDYSFTKEERLCLKRRFELLIEKGDSFFVYPFRVIYLENAFDNAGYPAQVAFAVRKKQFKRAVKRNLIKRRCKEAYRIQKQALYDFLVSENKTLLLLFVYSADNVMIFSEIYKKMNIVIERLTAHKAKLSGHETGS